MNSQEFSNKTVFLQSEEWRKFQESAGRRTFHVVSPHPDHLLKGEGDFSFWANIIEHKLPIIGSYFYIPRGPIICHPEFTSGSNSDFQEMLKQIQHDIGELLDLAKRENAGWIRIDPENLHILDLIRDNWRIVKAPHNMQPKEIFVIDITKSEEELLSNMKQKTRYNIKLAEKKGISLRTTNSYEGTNSGCINAFLRLVKATAERKKVKFHPEEYYRKMIEIIPGNILKLYCAEYNNKIIAANLVVFYNNTATYLHGATDDEYRNVMAPYLLHWQAIKDAKKSGYAFYDFGGVKTCHPERSEGSLNNKISSNSSGFFAIAQNDKVNDWAGVTKFKLGFSSNTKPVEFAGSYDIVLNPVKYWVYKSLQRLKSFVK